MKTFIDHTQWIESLPKRISSAAILLENNANQLLIIKNNYKDYWSLPGGIVDLGETPRQAAIREVTEEVGITLTVDQVEFVSVVDRISDEAQTYQFIFQSLVSVDESEIVLQVEEIDEYAFVSRKQVLSGDRHYSKVLYAWANGLPGYVEQAFRND